MRSPTGAVMRFGGQPHNQPAELAPMQRPCKPFPCSAAVAIAAANTAAAHDGRSVPQRSGRAAPGVEQGFVWLRPRAAAQQAARPAVGGTPGARCHRLPAGAAPLLPAPRHRGPAGGGARCSGVVRASAGNPRNAAASYPTAAAAAARWAAARLAPPAHLSLRRPSRACCCTSTPSLG